MSIKVFSIIVTYNPNIDDFLEVLNSHVKTSTSVIVIVDNNSLNKKTIQGSILKIDTTKEIQFESLEENMGIGFAQNHGIDIAISSSCSHFILFDQDSFVTSDIIDKLLIAENKLILEGHKLGAIGPNYMDTISKSIYKQILISNFRIKKISPDSSSNNLVKVSFLNASGTLVRSAVINSVGKMNENYFIDSVDIEWCFRANSQGFSFFVATNVILNHTIGLERIHSLGREISFHSPLRHYYMIRNKILLVRLAWVPLVYKIKIIFDILFKSPIYFIDMRFSKEFLSFYFKGILDGIKNKSGKYN